MLGIFGVAKHIVHCTRFYGKHYGAAKAARALAQSSYVAARRGLRRQDSETADVNGYKLALVPGDVGICAELQEVGVHEPLLTRIIPRVLRAGMTCIDAGANIGYYALMESRAVGSSGRVVALEPSPVNYERLGESIRLSGAENIDTYNMAAGNADGKVDFLLSDHCNISHVVPPGEEPRMRGTITKVPVRRLDGFLSEVGLRSIDFVRMDVEGYEVQVLEGMQETLALYHPIVQMEIHHFIIGDGGTERILELFQKAGYEVAYYVPRALDTAIIGTPGDITRPEMGKLMRMIHDGSIPGTFHVMMRHPVGP
ncbi:SAM dependent methyltransferase [Cenarchaeum symbiosum A]|uniref:SAM dependent methyltransferase n=1 Tax=Cenarchaeum symbiosum (strain A) TaxID=414004 RepID=A0RWB4_CENSY|nr:SAM dependent methyltransferase [Cenarchaeum symbiosum A]